MPASTEIPAPQTTVIRLALSIESNMALRCESGVAEDLTKGGKVDGRLATGVLIVV